MDESLNEVWQRYRRDRSDAAFRRLAEGITPLVRSVCAAHLRNRADVEDAVQETLAKLAIHAEGIHSSVASWAAQVARTTSMDLIRRAARQRARRRALADVIGLAGPPPGWLRAQERLPDLLERLPEAQRRLLVARYLREWSLADIAAAEGVSIATASRRVARATADLAAVLREEDLPAVWSGDLTDNRLRATPRWPRAGQRGDASLACRPGHSRPTRVGVVVSYTSSRLTTGSTFHPGLRLPRMLPIEMQVIATRLCDAPGFELVGITESGTTEHGVVERTLRDFGLTSGLIELDDADALQSLDLIFFGPVVGLAPGGLAALEGAVRGGVGLLNIGSCQGVAPIDADATVQRLLLADSPVATWHSPRGCGVAMPASTVRRHPVLAGVAPGASAGVPACGAAYRPVPDAILLMVRDDPVTPQHPPGTPPQRMPTLVAGQLGRGRVLVANTQSIGGLFLLPGLQGNFIANAFDWLARTT